MNEYPKIGEPIKDDHPAVFELVVEEHVPFIDPVSYGIKDVKGVNPNDYFITSGDAVEKARVLERDLWEYAGEIRKKVYELIANEFKIDVQEAQERYRNGVRPSKPKRFSEFELAVWKTAGQSRSLVNSLKKARGEACFLETEWEDHMLLCIPKNPRR